MDFTEASDSFIEMHQNMRSGTRLRRIRSGLGHAELKFLRKVWWPMFSHFENLHPEYEVEDYKEGYRYIDFAYIAGYFKVAIEIDGYGTHARNMSKWQFAEECHRQNLLIVDGWHLLRFSYDSIEGEARLCQQTIQQVLGRWQQTGMLADSLSISEREIVRLASRSAIPITPVNISKHLQVCTKSAHRLLHGLTGRNWLRPASGHVRITSYELHPSRKNSKL